MPRYWLGWNWYTPSSHDILRDALATADRRLLIVGFSIGWFGIGIIVGLPRPGVGA
jgi:hypothetical protein